MEPSREPPGPPRPPRRAPTARELALHDAAVAAGEPTYRDPRTGLLVLTAAFLAAQGCCCERGCRHCPFDDRRPAR